MTYQAYLDNIQAKTGKTPEDFKALAAKKGFLKPGVKAGEIVAWLKEDFGLGRGHAMAIVLLLRQVNAPRFSPEEGINRHFSGNRAHWRRPYDRLVRSLKKFGPDVSLAPTNTYISMLRSGRKFGVLQVTADRVDVGIKLKGMPVGGRFERSGNWNNMVTHRVRVQEPAQLDAEVLSWLHQAYEKPKALRIRGRVWCPGRAVDAARLILPGKPYNDLVHLRTLPVLVLSDRHQGIVVLRVF